MGLILAYPWSPSKCLRKGLNQIEKWLGLNFIFQSASLPSYRIKSELGIIYAICICSSLSYQRKLQYVRLTIEFMIWFTKIDSDDAENTTSKSHDPRTLLMAPAQQEEETILAEGTGVVPAKCSPKIKSELFSLL